MKKGRDYSNEGGNENTEVYYFTDGLYIQMPNQLKEKYMDNKGYKQEDDGKRNLAMNLLKEYKNKKKEDDFRPKLNEKAKVDIDNIIIKTERFLQERQVKDNKKLTMRDVFRIK